MHKQYIRFLGILLTLTPLSSMHADTIPTALKNDTLVKEAEAANIPKSPAPLPPFDSNKEVQVNEALLANSIIPKEGAPFSLQGAIAFTLQNQISLQIERLNISISKGVLQSSAAPFDYYLQASGEYIDQHNLLHSPLKTSKHGNETTGSAGATMRTRPGTSFAFEVGFDKTNDPFDAPPTDNTGFISFQVVQPLLRGFLYGVDWMQEKADEYELYATYYDNFQAISQAIFNTANEYWGVVEAQKELLINREAYKRIKELTTNIEELIKNDQYARDDLYQPQQQMINYELNIIEAQQSLYASLQSLKLAMGDISVCDFTEFPMSLTDDIVIPPLDTTDFHSQFMNYISYATTYAYKIQAATLRQIEAEILLTGATNDRLPTLDVVGGVSTHNFEIGERGKPLVSPLEMHRPQTNWNIGVNFSMPLYNDGPIGEWQQRRAENAQAILAVQLAKQQLIASLRTALFQQVSLKAALNESEENVRISRILFEGGVIQLQANMISLFDLISFEGRLTNALLQRVSIKTQYMQNIALLRFLTSTIFKQTDDCDIIELLNVSNLPDFRK